LENGAEALLTKPIDFGTLRNEIDTRVERRITNVLINQH
jgi:DNA-binding response OmpR family regulator